jgi:hypothetical protein
MSREILISQFNHLIITFAASSFSNLCPDGFSKIFRWVDNVRILRRMCPQLSDSAGYIDEGFVNRDCLKVVRLAHQDGVELQ